MFFLYKIGGFKKGYNQNVQNLTKTNKMSLEDEKNGSILTKSLHHVRPEETVLELDKLFKKTKTTPCLYYLPLNEEAAREKKKNSLQWIEASLIRIFLIKLIMHIIQ